MSNELWDDTVGKSTRRWPAAYDTCINQVCPRCKAAPGEQCVSTEFAHRGIGRKKAFPCVVRLGLGEGWASRASTLAR